MTAPLRPGQRYARAIARGRRDGGPGIRDACARALRDHERPPAGCRFDAELAAHVCDFFPRFLRHSKGEWAGQPFTLQPWQAFILEELYGWIREDGTRRYRVAYIEVARKNGKSSLLAGLALYALTADGEPGAEVYSAATTRDQARIVFDEASRMVKASPALASVVKPYRANLNVPGTAAKFQPLSSDYNRLDGLNVHLAAVDEVHAHPDGALWDVLETATGARRQPLIIGITTAGQDPAGFCGMLHQQAAQIARGTLENPAFFAFIADTDEGADWGSLDAWRQANPSLGVTVKVDALAEQAHDAEQNPSKQNAFRRYRVNQWATATERFIDLARWDACAGELDPAALEASLAGRLCYAGIDLSSTTDLSAVVLVFPPLEPEQPFDLVCRFYLPEERAYSAAAARADRVPYADWCRAGYLTATPGAVIDYGVIRADLEQLAERFELQQVGYDPWNATGLVTELEQEVGLQTVAVRQGWASMSAPTKEFQKLILSRQLRHGGHPVLRWMVDNLAVSEDPAGNLKPNKAKSRQRIDGCVAAIIGLDRALRNEGAPGPVSVYATQELIAL